MTEPQLSPDGQWWWDGHRWVPNAPSAYGASPPLAAGENDNKAIWSLVLSLLWICGVGSAAAVVLGHQSRRDAKRVGRQPSGLSKAGLIIGYVGLAISVGFFLSAVVAGFVQGIREGMNGPIETGPAAATLRQAAIAEERYLAEHHTYTASVAELGEQGFQPDEATVVRVLHADATSFCLSGLREGRTLYIRQGWTNPRTESCR